MNQISIYDAKRLLREHQKRQNKKVLLQQARDSLIDFIRYLHPNYSENWHHLAICDRLTRLLHERGQRIMIFVGPQRGKSEIVSRYFPAWWLGHFPASKNILASYSGDLANSFNRDSQKIMADPRYGEIFPGLKTGATIRYLKATQNEVETSEGGYNFSVGVGGSTTGRSAGQMASGKDEEEDSPGVFICDDPIKDLADAFSKTKRKGKMDWWRGVVSTRVHRTSHTILMHTRWHKADVAGQLLDDERDRWEILSFPEIGPDREFPNEYDPRTENTEALWPSEKGDYEELQATKESVGSYVWSALFQQKPKVEGGNIILDEWINLYTTLPFDPLKLKSSDIVQSWDLTFKETGTSYVCGVTLGKHNADYYLLDIYHKKAGIIETKEALKKMYNSWPNCHTVLVEEKANGAAILALLKGIVPMVAVNPETSKDERLVAVAPIFESGNFHAPANHPKTVTIIDELTSFPNVENDDIVDAISQGLIRFGKLKGLRYLRAYKK